MADAADAITNGFAAVFGCREHRGEPHPVINTVRQKCSSFLRGMCFFHVKQNVEKKILMLSDTQLQNEILQSICNIQRCQSTQLFNIAIDLFNRKYE